MEKIEIKNLEFTYPTKMIPSLLNVSLEINDGDFVILFGKSGCGKSTLAKTITKLVNPTSGEVLFKDKNIFKHTKEEKKEYPKQVQMVLKNEIRLHGNCKGEILVDGKPIFEVDTGTNFGFVMQNPDNQIVCDKVYHELAFGLENLKVDTEDIRARVAEIASFFNMQDWFYEDVSKLSGGQKQKLNLASVMVMNPDVLILDEPTSRLDPIAAEDFLKSLKKINEELRNNYNYC